MRNGCMLSELYRPPSPVITIDQFVILLEGLFKTLMKRARLSKTMSKWSRLLITMFQIRRKPIS